MNTTPATFYTMVQNFHRLMGHMAPDSYQTNFSTEHPSISQLRINLVNEELQETLNAWEANDSVEFLDGLADMLYVLHGYLVTIGTEDPDYQVCDTSSEMKEQISADRMSHVKGLISHELKQLQNCMKTLSESADNLPITEKCIREMIFTIYRISTVLNINIRLVFEEVHRSNMSKSCATLDLATQTIEWYQQQHQEGNLPYDTPTCRIADGGNAWVVFNKSTGKILKSIEYSPANISMFVTQN